MPSVLFICTANRFRSPLAAAFFQQSLEERGLAHDWIVSSAGTWALPGLPVLPAVLLAASSYGIDLSSHRSACVNGETLSGSDLVVVMQASQKEALLAEEPMLREHIHLLSEATESRTYDIPDALASERETLEVISELHTLIGSGFESICGLAIRLRGFSPKTGIVHGRM